MALKQTVCSFSGVYSDEGWSPAGDSILLDFSDIPGTSCYLDGSARADLENAIAPCPCRSIHWIDTGDYHYMSALWLQKLASPARLILFDNHPDDQAGAFGQELLSCGSWVSYVRRLPNWREDASDVYISIDKDVLSREYARTDWNQGSMTLDELFAAIKDISLKHKIIGIDVCGEPKNSEETCSEDVSINSKTNRLIRDFLLNLPGFE